MAGADGIAFKEDEMIFWQAKFNQKIKSNNVAQAIKEFKKFPYPPFVECWIIVWAPRAREPEIVVVN